MLRQKALKELEDKTTDNNSFVFSPCQVLSPDSR